MEVALSVGVQKMVRSDLACSGVMFSIDTETGFKNAVLLSAAYGLGENVVQARPETVQSQKSQTIVTANDRRNPHFSSNNRCVTGSSPGISYDCTSFFHNWLPIGIGAISN